MSDSEGTCAIPIDRVSQGLALVALNVQHLCKDSHELMRSGSPWHAVAMAIFALEELAKYYDLKRKRASALRSRTNVIKVDERLFGRGRGNSHLYKLQMAKDENLIPPDAWQIHTADADVEYALHKALLGSADFNVKDATVSDWINEEWEIGSNYEPHRLKMLVDAITEKLKQLMAEDD
jgi:AbiV family abortive infection protein